MRFSSIHKLSAYLMALSALFALLSSPEVSLSTSLATLLGVGLSWFAEPSRYRLERFALAWNIATVLFVAYLVAGLVRGAPVILAGADFLLFVLCNKLFNRRTSRDYLQACVVSFLILVVATTLNTSLTYAIAFVAYVVFATWTLILLHLRREMEENYLLKHSEGAQSEKVEVERILSSRRVVGGQFLAGTSLISVGVIIASALVFLLFPRVGLSIFLGHKRGGIIISGFEERVELGHHGLVRDNPAVVMRVAFPGGRVPGPLRWRGSAFDYYQDGVWSHSEDLIGRTQMVTPSDGLYVFNHAPGLPQGAPPRALRGLLLRQEIYLEPLSSSVLFAADRPVAVEAPRRQLGVRLGGFLPRRGPLGEIRIGTQRNAGLSYVAYSDIRSPSPAVLRQATPLQEPRLERFLQLPRALPPRVGDLARHIVRGKTTIYDQATAVQEHLRAHYRYSLQLTHTPGLEPVDEFLFVTRSGHCEYFASAMALLLRSVQIQARSVNGFAGGAWNGFGKYLAVRQGDAHSWVEVLFPNVGWVTFDPTPPSAAGTPPTGVIGSFNELLDALRMRWHRHVVEYDLRQQVSALKRAQRWLAPPPAGGRHARWPRWPIIGTLLALALAGVLVRRHLLRTRRARGGAPRETRRLAPASQLYARLLAVLARAGHPKPPGATPQEFTEELRRRGFGPLAPVEKLTGWYYQARYGGEGASSEALRQMAGLVEDLRRALRS